MIKTMSLAFNNVYPTIIYGNENGLSNLIVSTILFSSRGRLLSNSNRKTDIYSYLFNSIPPTDLDNLMSAELTQLIESTYRVDITSISINRQDSLRVANLEINYSYDDKEYQIIIQNKIKDSLTNQKNKDIL